MRDSALRGDVFLDEFAKIAGGKKRLLSSCLSAPDGMEQFGSHWTDFHEIWYLRIFGKSVGKIIHFSLKSDKNYWYFTWKPIYIFDHISLSSS